MDDVVLRHVPEQPAKAVQVPVQVDAVEQHRAALGRPHSRQRLQQRGLARPAAADNGDELVGPHAERHAVEDVFAAPDRLPQVTSGDLHAASGATAVSGPRG